MIGFHPRSRDGLEDPIHTTGCPVCPRRAFTRAVWLTLRLPACFPPVAKKGSHLADRDRGTGSRLWTASWGAKMNGPQEPYQFNQLWTSVDVGKVQPRSLGINGSAFLSVLVVNPVATGVVSVHSSDIAPVLIVDPVVTETVSLRFPCVATVLVVHAKIVEDIAVVLVLVLCVCADAQCDCE